MCSAGRIILFYPFTFVRQFDFVYAGRRAEPALASPFDTCHANAAILPSDGPHSYVNRSIFIMQWQAEHCCGPHPSETLGIGMSREPDSSNHAILIDRPPLHFMLDTRALARECIIKAPIMTVETA